MRGMDKLIAFVSARLDEDEAAAKAAVDSSMRAKCAQWIAYPDGNGYVIGDAGGHFASCLIGGEGIARHVVRHDPARALREVEAKRAILAMYEERDDYYLPKGVHDGRDPDERQCDAAAKAAYRDALEAIAAVWSDHADYRQEWKP